MTSDVWESGIRDLPAAEVARVVAMPGGFVWGPTEIAFWDEPFRATIVERLAIIRDSIREMRNSMQGNCLREGLG